MCRVTTRSSSLECHADFDDRASLDAALAGAGLDVDIAGLRRAHPEVGWHSFTDWAAGQDWPALLRPVPAAPARR